MDSIEFTSAKQLQKLFNESAYPAQIEDGTLRAIYLRNSHLSLPEERGEPFCTRAQMIRFVDKDGRWVVEVFQYLRLDKSLGASGMPDPKRIRIDGKIFALEPLHSG